MEPGIRGTGSGGAEESPGIPAGSDFVLIQSSGTEQELKTISQRERRFTVAIENLRFETLSHSLSITLRVLYWGLYVGLLTQVITRGPSSR